MMKSDQKRGEAFFLAEWWNFCQLFFLFGRDGIAFSKMKGQGKS